MEKFYETGQVRGEKGKQEAGQNRGIEEESALPDLSLSVLPEYLYIFHLFQFH